jgi:hypothetical protein
MKKYIKIVALFAILVFSLRTYSQTMSKSCRNPIENKSISLCNSKSDTLTYAQLKNCGELQTNNKKEKIDSYRLSFALADGSEVIEYKGTSNKIPYEALNMIIESKTNKILFEEIYGTKDNENIVLGLRWFYLKQN